MFIKTALLAFALAVFIFPQYVNAEIIFSQTTKTNDLENLTTGINREIVQKVEWREATSTIGTSTITSIRFNGQMNAGQATSTQGVITICYNDGTTFGTAYASCSNYVRYTSDNIMAISDVNNDMVFNFSGGVNIGPGQRLNIGMVFFGAGGTYNPYGTTGNPITEGFCFTYTGVSTTCSTPGDLYFIIYADEISNEFLTPQTGTQYEFNQFIVSLQLPATTSQYYITIDTGLSSSYLGYSTAESFTHSGGTLILGINKDYDLAGENLQIYYSRAIVKNSGGATYATFYKDAYIIIPDDVPQEVAKWIPGYIGNIYNYATTSTSTLNYKVKALEDCDANTSYFSYGMCWAFVKTFIPEDKNIDNFTRLPKAIMQVFPFSMALDAYTVIEEFKSTSTIATTSIDTAIVFPMPIGTSTLQWIDYDNLPQYFKDTISEVKTWTSRIMYITWGVGMVWFISYIL